LGNSSRVAAVNGDGGILEYGALIDAL